MLPMRLPLLHQIVEEFSDSQQGVQGSQELLLQ